MDILCAEKYAQLIRLLIRKGITVTAMESCTGGYIASLLTDTEGSSQVFKGSFVTYSNEAKVMCGVPEDVIGRYGVYSPQCAREMALACRKAFNANIGIGVTGSFSNPDPANADSIPGKVFFAICALAPGASEEQMIIEERCLTGIAAISRHEGKIMVADRIADVLLEMIQSL